MKKVVNIDKELFPLKKDMMKKHGFGKIGIISNHYKLKINETQKFQEWFIKIINKEDKLDYQKNQDSVKDALPMDAREKRDEVYSMNSKGVYKILGDCIPTGNNLFTLKKQNYEKNKYFIFERHPKFDFILEFTKEINFSDLKGDKKCRLPILRMINSCFKQILKKRNFIEWGQNKKYYNNKVFEKLPKHNITVYKGCTFKAEMLENGINITVGPTNRIIRDKNFFLTFLEEKIPKNNKDSISQFFIGKSGLCIYNQKIVRIDGVDFSKTILSPFPNPKFKNYKEYFEKNYNSTFKYKDQFLLIRNRKQKVTLKTGEIKEEEFIEHFPPELLKPTGLTDKMRSDWRVMKDLGQITIDNPQRKFENIRQSLKLIEDNKKNSGIDFSIDIVNNKVVGYTLKKPRLFGKNGNTTQFKGDRITLKDMAKSQSIDNWVFFYDYRLSKEFVKVIKSLMKASGRYKIKILEPRKALQIPKNNSPGVLWDLMKKNKVQDSKMVFFFVTPMTGKYIYKKMKIFFTGKKGILSQFFTSYNPRKDSNNMSKFGNIVLQMSVKLGASPWGMNLNLPKTVIFGADVYHEKKNLSVAALVSLFGPKFFRRYSTQKIQKKGQEIMKNMSEMVLKHLEHIIKVTKNIPENILFYRDGVGEGQVPIVIEYELKKIINSLYSKYSARAPKITFIIVTKRIDDRIAIMQNNKTNNPNGGLIVMDGITKIDKVNFFMISQKVTQGTARPTHYEIIINQCKWDLPFLQKVTYDLTHLYYNWMGAVKVPAVVQYAHTCTNLFGIMQNDTVKESIQTKFHYL